MQIVFDLKDDTPSGRAFRGLVSAPWEAGDTAELLAIRACEELGRCFDLQQLDERDLKDLREATARWVTNNRAGIHIGDTREATLEYILRFPPPRETGAIAGQGMTSGSAPRESKHLGRKQR